MRVRRKPHTIKGPWAMKRVGHGKGQPHPNRTSPPHSAVSKASRPSAIRGKRTLLSIGNTLFHSAAYRRVLPASGGCNSLVDLTGTPATWLVFIHRCASLQHRVDDAPGLFNIILSGKQGRIACHGVPEHPLVSIQLFCTGVVARQQLHLLADHLLLRVHHRQTKGARDLGTDAEVEIVLRGRAGRKDRWRPAQADHDLRASHGQRLAGPNVKRHSLPAPVIYVFFLECYGYHRDLQSFPTRRISRASISPPLNS